MRSLSDRYVLGLPLGRQLCELVSSRFSLPFGQGALECFETFHVVRLLDSAIKSSLLALNEAQ